MGLLFGAGVFLRAAFLAGGAADAFFLAGAFLADDFGAFFAAFFTDFAAAFFAGLGADFFAAFFTALFLVAIRFSSQWNVNHRTDQPSYTELRMLHRYFHSVITWSMPMINARAPALPERPVCVGFHV